MYCQGPPDRHILFSPGTAYSCKGPSTSGVIVRGCKVLGAMPDERGSAPPHGFKSGISVGSEGSAGVENIWILGIDIERRTGGLTIRSNPERRGIYRKIHVQGIKMRKMNIKNPALWFTQTALMRTLLERSAKGDGPLQDFQKHHMKELCFEDISVAKVDAEIGKGGEALHATSYSYFPDTEELDENEREESEDE